MGMPIKYVMLCYVMLLTRGRHFVGPLQQISLGGNTVKLVEASRCLGVQLDNELKWDTHVNELIKSYTKKLNLLRSMHFLPVKPRTDFYFKVILSSVTYGIAVWESCGSMLFTELEKIHVRAAKIIQIRLVNSLRRGPSKSKLAYTKNCLHYKDASLDVHFFSWYCPNRCT